MKTLKNKTVEGLLERATEIEEKCREARIFYATAADFANEIRQCCGRASINTDPLVKCAEAAKAAAIAVKFDATVEAENFPTEIKDIPVGQLVEDLVDMVVDAALDGKILRKR